MYLIHTKTKELRIDVTTPDGLIHLFCESKQEFDDILSRLIKGADIDALVKELDRLAKIGCNRI